MSVATSAATAAVSWAQARHGFDVASAHDEAIWRNILALAPHFAHQNGTGFRAKHATDFVRAQKADSENVSGSDADAGSSRSTERDPLREIHSRIRQVVVASCLAPCATV